MSSRNRPKSSKVPRKVKTPNTNEPPNFKKMIDYTSAYELQNNNIRLQESILESTEELTDILSNSLSETKKWKKKWYRTYANEQSRITNSESIWHIFGASIRSIGDYIETIRFSVENLKQLKDSIPKIDKRITFESKINEARSSVDDLEKEFKKLEEDKSNLEIKINKFGNTSSIHSFNCIKSEEKYQNFLERQSSTDVLIENVKQSLKNEKKIFCQEQIKLYEQYKKTELERWKYLQQQLIDFLQSFNIKSEYFNQLIQNYNPENDFQRWEQEILYPSINQSCKYQSIEEEV